MSTDNHPPVAPTSPEAQLVAAEALTQVGPPDLTQPPVIEANPGAIQAYTWVAEADAARPGIDDKTPAPADPPAAGLVMSTAVTPLIRLGERFAAFHATYTRGLLGVVTPEPVKALRIFAGLWPLVLVAVVLLGAAVTVEVIYGSAAADLLSRQSHDTAVAAAIATTITLNGVAWVLAEYAYRNNPQLARRRGLWITLIGFVLITVVVTLLGLVIGGWDPLEFSTVTGGGSTTVTEVEADTRPLLAGTYMVLVLLTCLGIAAGHYLIKDLYETRHVNAVKTNEQEALERSLTAAQQQDLAARLAQTYLDAVPAAEQHVETRLETYNTVRARNSSPDVNDATAALTYEPTTPLWTAQANQLVNRTRTGARHSTGHDARTA